MIFERRLQTVYCLQYRMKVEKKKAKPSAIVKVRSMLKLNQAEFALQIMELLPADKHLSTAFISAWETGRRPCPADCVNIIAKLGNVPISFMYGETDEFGRRIDEEYLKEERIFELTFEQLPAYDRKPVYVEFLQHQKENAWGLYTDNTEEIIFTDCIISVNENNRNKMKIYAREPVHVIPKEDLFHKKLDLNSVYEAESVYIVMASPDPQIRAMYNGWYSHNANHTALQSEAGLVLPYSGLGVSYMAYYKTNFPV